MVFCLLTKKEVTEIPWVRVPTKNLRELNCSDGLYGTAVRKMVASVKCDEADAFRNLAKRESNKKEEMRYYIGYFFSLVLSFCLPNLLAFLSYCLHFLRVFPLF